ncbi:hypothetical protein [Chelatococcus reniformis]|uniref:hypothetical protein n=1 Tax=Chelatococcus reniformis TaxID=1494448 RepID=UPI001AEE6E75|nr:hypothetical protein [Chelatococcus reniformis]
MADPSVYRKAWVSIDAHDGRKSLAFEVAGCADRDRCSDKAMQKVNYQFLYTKRNDELAARFGQRIHLGFRFKVDTVDGADPAILTQFWQGAPHGPPFALSIASRSPGKFSVRASVANDHTGSNPSAKRIPIGSRDGLEVGRWYTVTMDAMPIAQLGENQEEPTLSIWIGPSNSNEKTSLARYEGAWGYTNSPANCVYARRCETKPPNAALDFAFGLYRKASELPIRVEFDDIRLSSRADSADPDCANAR